MLRIARLTDHAIVLLAHMTRHRLPCVHAATSLAEATALPLPTVQKVLKMLGTAGLVDSRRGAMGGYVLSRDPASVTLDGIIAAMEGPLALTACASSQAEGCAEHAHCLVGDHWPVINDAVSSALRRVTLLDLSRPASHASLRAALAASPA
jgi:FeS assembly SUF system regulator